MWIHRVTGFETHLPSIENDGIIQVSKAQVVLSTNEANHTRLVHRMWWQEHRNLQASHKELLEVVEPQRWDYRKVLQEQLKAGS